MRSTSFFALFVILHMLSDLDLSTCQFGGILSGNSNLYNTFIPIYDNDMASGDQTGITLDSYQTTSKYDCFMKCNLRSDCVMISFKLNQCMLFSQVKYSVSSTAVYLYEKFIPDFTQIQAAMSNHWPFNSNLNDIISGANLLNPVNILFTTDRLGTQSSAIYINCGSLTIPSGTYISGDFTATAWVKVHALTNSNARLFELNSDAKTDYLVFYLSYSTSSMPAVALANNGVVSGNVVSDIALSLNTWYHLAFTLSGTTATLYVNGVQRVQQTLSTGPRSMVRSNNKLGLSPYTSSTNVNAEIDDLKIFNRSLTQSEVVMVTNSYSADNTLADILLSMTNHWTFNTNLVDSITSVSLSNPTNVVFTIDRSGSPSSSIYLNSGYLTISSTTVTIATSFTMSVWIKLHAITNQAVLFDCGTSTPGQQNFLVLLSSLLSGNPLISICTDSYCPHTIATKSFTVNTWQHMAITFNSKYQSFYIDGVLAGQFASSLLNAPSQTVNRTNCYIGYSTYMNVSSWDYVNAELDDLLLFNRALSPSEVVTIMNMYVPNDYIRLANYLTNQWTFNQNLADSIGTASLINPINVLFTTDRYGVSNSALFLVSGYVAVPTGTYFNGDFSITAWVTLLSSTAWVRLMDFNPSNSIIFSLTNSASANLLTMQLMNPSNVQTSLTGTTALALNTWYHVAYTQSSTTGTLYLNAASYATLTMPALTSLSRSQNYFGKSNSGNPNATVYFDDIMFFNIGLAQTEVKTVMNLFIPNTFIIIAYSLTNQWTFNQNLIDLVTSQSLTSPMNVLFATDRLGSVNSAIFLNYGSLTIPPGFFFGTDLSITAWVYINSFIYSSRVIDFGTTSRATDNVVITIEDGTTQRPGFYVINNGVETYIVSSTAISLTTWVHLAATLGGTTGTLYMNGAQVASSSAFVTTQSLNRTLGYIGKCNLWPSQTDHINSNAVFDDIMLFSYALTQSDVQTVMNVYIPNDNIRVTAVLVNQWTFNQNLVDQITSVSLTNPTSIAFISDRAGSPNSALYLSSGYLTAPTASYFSPVFTYTMWVNIITIPSSKYDALFLFNFGDGAGNVNLVFGNPGKFGASVYNSGQTCSTGLVNPLITAGTWNHIAVNFASTKALSLYVNAALTSTSTCANALTSVTRSYSMIGRSNSASNSMYGGSLYPGIDAAIDDFMIFSNKLDRNDIATVMNTYYPNDYNRIFTSVTNQWTFNQNVMDSMTSLNLISVVNSAFTTDRLGAVNSAIYLNNGYLAAPADVYFNSDFSVTGWVYMMCAWMRFFDFGNGQATQVVDVTLVTSGGTPYTEIYSPTQIYFYASKVNTLNTWQFIAVTLTGTVWTLFFDGVQVGQSTGKTPIDTSRAKCYFGKDNWSGTPVATAYFDDMMIFNRGLTATEVTSVMNAYFPSAFNCISSSLTNQWTFNHNIIDSVTMLSLTYPTNVAFTGDRVGNADSAICLNLGYLTMQAGNYFGGDFSISAWVFPIQFTDCARILDCGTSDPYSTNVVFAYSTGTNGQPYVLINNPSSYTGSGTGQLTQNTWNHLAVTLSGTLLTQYLKGVVIYSSSAFGAPKNVSRPSCYIGKSNWGTNGLANAYFDDIMVFGRGLSQAEVLTAMNSYFPNDYTRIATSITNQWSFNQNFYDSITVVSLTSPTNAQFVADRAGADNSAVYFNSGYAVMPSGVYFSGDFTITAWVNMQGAGASCPRLVDIGTSSTGQDNIVVTVGRSSLTMPFVTYFSNSASGSLTYNTAMTLNIWYHMGITLIGTAGVLYMNGNSVVANALVVPRAVTRTQNYIGKSNWGSVDGNVIAYIDDLLFFNRGLSQAEMLTIMYSYTINTFPMIAASIINQWTFNQNLYDSITGLSLSTPTNIQFVADRTGAPNSAIFFNSGYATIPSGVYFTGDFSITAWVNTQGAGTNFPRLVDLGASNAGTDDIAFAIGQSSTTQPILGFTSNSVGVRVSWPSALSLNVWYHLALTLSGTTVALYLDGSIVATGTVPLIRAVTRTQCYVAKSNWGVDGNAIAYFDDLFFFNRALSALEMDIVKKVYIPSDYPRIVSSLTNYWTFNQKLYDEMTGLSLNTPLNMLFTADRYGATGSAARFNWGYLSMFSGVYFSGDLTITSWVSVQSFAPAYSIVVNLGTTAVASDDVLLGMQSANSGQPYFQIFNAYAESNVVSPTALVLNTWTHLAATLSGTTGTFYFNGNAVKSGTMLVPRAITRTNCYVAKSNWGWDNLQVAYIDDVMFFNRALTQSEVVTIMNSYTPNDYIRISANIINQWSFNQNLLDSITGVSLSTPSNIQFVADRIGATNSAIYFNSGYATMPSGIYFSGDFSVSVWVNIQAAAYNVPRVFDCGTATVGADNVALAIGKSSTTVPVMGIDSNSVGNSIAWPNALSINVWYHLASALSGTTIVHFLDGSVATSATIAVPRSVMRTNCYIAKSNWGSDGNAIAYFDDLLFFSRSLTAAEIKTVMYSYTLNEYNLISGSVINQWLFNHNYLDSITGKYLYNPVNVAFTADRLGAVNSAIYLNSGYLCIPADYFFTTTNYAACGWAYCMSNWIRLFDVGNGAGAQVVDITMRTTSGLPFAEMYNPSCQVAYANQNNKLNAWQHVAMTLSGTLLTYYFDGVQVGQLTSATAPENVIRYNSYIGKDNWNIALAVAYFDDIMFFNRALSQTEIHTVMNAYFPSDFNTIDQYITHQWTFSGNLVDSVGGANVVGYNSVSYWVNRRGYVNMALYFNSGYLVLPAGVYFNSDYSITAWMYYAQACISFQRLVDCGNGPAVDDVDFSPCSGWDGFPYTEIWNPTLARVSTNTAITVGVWQFYASTLSGSLASVYLDGAQIGQNAGAFAPNNVVRSNCYIGKSNWGDANGLAYYDDVLFFNRGLSQSEVLIVMKADF